MSTIRRGIVSGLAWGMASGAVVGASVATIEVLRTASTELALSLLVMTSVGSVLGVMVGAVTGLSLGLAAGAVLNLLLGPVGSVPRRTEQIPTVRLTGALVGLLPLAVLPIKSEWWPLLIVAALVASVAIAARAPRIAGISVSEGRSIIQRSPFSAEV